MRSLKAIVAGSVFIIIVGLLFQLAYILSAVAYMYVAKSYPFLNDIAVYFKYLIGFPVFFMLMFAGGYITADLSPRQILPNCLLVALITMSLTMLSALSYSEMTVTGVIVLLVAVVSTLTGGWYWQHEQLKKTGQLNAPCS